MATAPQAVSQSPPGGGQSPQGGGATQPPTISPAQGQQNPALRNAISQFTAMAQMAQRIAQAYPQCSQEMREIGERIQRCLMKVTQAQQQSEPAAPPV
jgi:hypothetical protein